MGKNNHKIKRTKSLYGNKRKNKTKRTIMVIVTIIIVLVLIFLGYSIGDPLVNFFKNLSNQTTTDTTPWIPPTTTTEVTTTVDTTIVTEKDISISDFKAIQLTTDDIISKESLQAALNTAKSNGFTAVVVPLKERGGAIYYKSDYEGAIAAGAVKSELTLNEITDIIDSNDMISIGKMSVLFDNIAPNAEKLISYQFADGISSWYDNSPQMGGKKWISPFAQEGQDYIYSVASEILNSDFDAVICSDVIFPLFRTTDLNYIGEIVKNPDRYKALTEIVNNLAEEADRKGKKLYLQVSAYRIENELEEVLKPDEITGADYILTYDAESEFTDAETFVNSEKFVNTIKAFKETIGPDNNLVPIINLGNNLTPEDMQLVTDKLNEMNFNSYIIR